MKFDETKRANNIHKSNKAKEKQQKLYAKLEKSAERKKIKACNNAKTKIIKAYNGGKSFVCIDEVLVPSNYEGVYTITDTDFLNWVVNLPMLSEWTLLSLKENKFSKQECTIAFKS